MDAYLELDFDKKVITGFNILTLVSQVDFLYDIILDIKGMDISKVTKIDDEEVTFTVSKTNPELGDSLHVFLNTPINKGKSIDLIVYFTTNTKQTATSWVDAVNTPGGNIPMMYT